ncbi:MAG TPA: glycosyltransferase family 4 protein [Burkholderiales bacterium]
MKLLYHHRIGSKDGQYVHIEELVGALRRLGHEVIVVAPPATDRKDFGGEAGFVSALKRFLPRFVYELLELGYSVLDYRRVARVIRASRPDAIYERYNLYLPSGVWAHRRFGLPLLMEVNAPLYAERKKYSGISLDALARWTERFAWRGADFVLPVTAVLAREAEQVGVPPERIVVIPNGIDRERFSNAPATDEAKAALGLHGRLVLGFVGFMREWHGLERLIDFIAAAGDPHRHLLLVGDGPARGALEARARDRGVATRVTFAGLVGRDRIAEHIAAFDIALQPEVVAYASPLKLFEYLALGRAVVAPATPNIMEVLTHESNALLFDPKSPGAFDGAVERLCGDRALRVRLGNAAKETIDRKGLTWDNNARRVEALFERLLRGQGD